jgi:hypothetical protein
MPASVAFTALSMPVATTSGSCSAPLDDPSPDAFQPYTAQQVVDQTVDRAHGEREK